MGSRRRIRPSSAPRRNERLTRGPGPPTPRARRSRRFVGSHAPPLTGKFGEQRSGKVRLAARARAHFDGARVGFEPLDAGEGRDVAGLCRERF